MVKYVPLKHQPSMNSIFQTEMEKLASGAKIWENLCENSLNKYFVIFRGHQRKPDLPMNNSFCIVIVTMPHFPISGKWTIKGEFPKIM